MNRFNRRQRIVIRLIVVNLVLLVAALVWQQRERAGTVQLAVAKGKTMLDMITQTAPSINVTAVQDIALADAGLTGLTAGKSVEFVNAVLLSAGEARYWQEEGCDATRCAHVVYYNRTDGGTIEALVDVETAAVIARWTNVNARPGGSTYILDRAMAIAAADSQVRSVLGANIGAADPAMVPMSGWLADNSCRDEWCVDLTFHDPNGTGRIYHVFVNMEREEVARTFYTRGREDRSMAKPPAQRNAYTDGCNEQYGWNVCWEMTAHDGVLFRDATYDSRQVFSSVKIGQVEAWYPSWPGGYRDEIGFSASVPPFGDTLLTDLGNGFEVRQMFTEFTRWPNCICCYRYEEIMQFYDNGRFTLQFVSHGPGCDDLSVYRPFWRIDLDLDGPEDDHVWEWQETAWVEQAIEFETHPFVEGLSPDGYKLATFTGDNEMVYRWRMDRTDPLALDEAYAFGLQFKEEEGTGPIVTGPGDTFIPPRQWIDGDRLSGENIVLWYVPLLKTKKGGPWWCMPDPEPDFSPCEAVLRADPTAELTQPTTAEMEALAEATAVAPTPTAESITATSTPAPTPTPRPIEGVAAEEIILNAGCGSCHQIGSLGEAHKVGPDLSAIGVIAAGRVAGMSAEEYIRQSILQPNAYLAPECPNGPCIANIMPQDYATRLTPEQLDILVRYLLALDGSGEREVEVIGGDGAPADGSAWPAPKTGAAPKTVNRTPVQQQLSSTTAVQVLLLTLVLLLALVRVFVNPPE